MKAIEFIYQENEIHFLVNPQDQNVMVNATEMAKPFNKTVRYILRLDGTKAFIEALIEKENIRADVHGYSIDDVVKTNYKAGTYMNRKLAIKFAAWLDVRFELWIVDCIDDLIFGNYKKHWEAHTRQEVAKQEMEKCKLELYANPTHDTVEAYFKNEREYKDAKKARTQAIRNQLSLFDNE